MNYYEMNVTVSVEYEDSDDWRHDYRDPDFESYTRTDDLAATISVCAESEERARQVAFEYDYEQRDYPYDVTDVQVNWILMTDENVPDTEESIEVYEIETPYYNN